VTEGSDRPVVSRRVALAGTALGSLAVLTACTDGSPSSPTPAASGLPGTGVPTDDDGVRAARVATELALVRDYDRAIAAQAPGRTPSDREQLRAFRAHHLAHAIALDPNVDPSLTATAAPTGSPAPRPAPTRAALRTLEAQAAASAVDLCVASSSPELSQLLSQIGSSEAAHAALLAISATRST